MAGIAANAMDTEFKRLEPAVTDGRLSLSEAYARILRACGREAEPGLVDSVADKSRELLLASARLYDDVLPFLRTLRSCGVRTAIVSNCDENTRDLLVELGVAALADDLVLSCEVGAAKPAGAIFHLALDQLGVAAGAAVFVDDQPLYCAGAAALGISAVQIVRDDSNAPSLPLPRRAGSGFRLAGGACGAHGAYWGKPCRFQGRGGLTARVAKYPGMYRAVASA